MQRMNTERKSADNRKKETDWIRRSKQAWMTAIFFLLLLLTVVWDSGIVKAADKLEANKNYSFNLKDTKERLYEFTAPTAGNIRVNIKNEDPAGTGEIRVQMFDSNNLPLTDTWVDTSVELPVYSTDGNRTFYIKIEHHYGYTEGDYSLNVGFEPTKDWETEGNDNSESADTITEGKKWYGTISERNDPCDYFKFKLSSNKKVRITFGPKEVTGDWHDWYVYLIDSNNQSVKIYSNGTTEHYDCYLKKGTYYLKVENSYRAKNVTYALSVETSALKLVKPVITSIEAVAIEGVLSNWVELDPIRIKNSGDATGYTIKVARKKDMKGVLGTQDIELKDRNTKKQVTLDADITVLRSYYVQARSYVQDPFGEKIYGKYGSVKSKTLKSSVYARLAE